MTHVSDWSAPPLVVQTHGMGVDSAWWTTAILNGTLPRDFDLADLTIVTAMVGNESEATREAMESHLLPLLRKHSIRYVQVARASMDDRDGVRVLSDTRPSNGNRPDPYRMVMAGAVTLADELLAAGTVPQVSNRRCSHKWKGWVLDRWLESEFGDTPRRHVVGFAAEETGRSKRDEGYSTKVPGKIPWYPIIEAGVDRERCIEDLWRWYGIEWPRSCCFMCPFQAGPDIARMIGRWRAEPDQVVNTVAMEMNARALNPRMVLFGDRSAADVARRAGLGEHVDRAADVLAGKPHELYEVRRIYRRAGDRRPNTEEVKEHGYARDGWVLGPDPDVKGNDVWRSLRPIAAGTRNAMYGRLLAEHAERGGDLETVAGNMRLMLHRAEPPYPTTEHYLAVAVAGARKERDAFDSLWTFVTGITPGQQQLSLIGGTPC